ncbi:MAG: hypothetical protein GY715_19825 [Planctomycetes bacterium]|nr:hypothetical protein [Planctomycetota bacterium]
MRRLIAMFLLVAAVAAPAAALTDVQREQLLGEAATAYDRGIEQRRRDPAGAKESFRAAALRFEQVADDGVVNGHLQYNLGNAWLQAGELGRAILHYRRAEKLIPGDHALTRNLAYARSLRRNRIAPSGERALGAALLSWHESTGLAGRYVGFVVVFAVVWLGLLAHVFRPSAPLRWITGVAAVAALALGASVAADVLHDEDASAGVILVDDVIARKGNGDGFEPQFEEPLHQGVEFAVVGRRPEWLHIELPDRSTGWIRDEQAGLVGAR